MCMDQNQNDEDVVGLTTFLSKPPLVSVLCIEVVGLILSVISPACVSSVTFACSARPDDSEATIVVDLLNAGSVLNLVLSDRVLACAILGLELPSADNWPLCGRT